MGMVIWEEETEQRDKACSIFQPLERPQKIKNAGASDPLSVATRTAERVVIPYQLAL